MALQSVLGAWQGRSLAGAALDATSLVIDASGEMIQTKVKIQKAGQIKKVGILTGALVQNQTIRFSLQNLDASGNPDGTQDQFRDVAFLGTDDNIYKESGIISSDGTDTGSLRTVAVGDEVAFVFENTAFAAGDIFRIAALSNVGPMGSLTTYAANFASAAWTRRAFVPILVLIYSDDLAYYHPFLAPYTSFTIESWNSGSTPSRRGFKFRVPYPFEINGAYLGVVANATVRDFNIVLYDSDGTSALETVSIDADTLQSITAAQLFVPFTKRNLSANTYYYIMAVPTTVNNISLNFVTVNAAQHWDQEHGGQDIHWAEGSGSTPTAVTTKRPLGSILISKLDDGAASGPTGTLFAGQSVSRVHTY